MLASEIMSLTTVDVAHHFCSEVAGHTANPSWLFEKEAFVTATDTELVNVTQVGDDVAV